MGVQISPKYVIPIPDPPPPGSIYKIIYQKNKKCFINKGLTQNGNSVETLIKLFSKF